MAGNFKAKYGGSLKKYWQWTIILALSIVILIGLMFWVDMKAGLIALGFGACYMLLLLWIYLRFKPRILRELIHFVSSYGKIQDVMLEKLEIPTALLEPDGRILWMNDKLCEITGKSRNYKNYKKNISVLFPEINRGVLPSEGSEKDIRFRYKEKDYRAAIRKISIDEMIEEVMILEKDSSETYMYMIYFFDETELNFYIRENWEQRPVVGLAYIDNYEEVMDDVDEVHQSLLSVLVDRKVNKYFNQANALIRKIEKDKYLILMKQKDLTALTEDRFSLLEGVKTISIGNELGMTMSIGIGVDGSGYQQNYEYSRGAIEMALARGGDQAVVKDSEKLSYYGGKSQRNEKSTRVKARVKAQAMQEIFMTRDNVVVMGHKITDMDSLGACIGVCCAAKSVGKPAHIVVGEVNSSIRWWVNQFRNNKEYDADLFIDHDRAKELVDHNTALVVVDTNRPSMTECQELLTRTKTVIVLDHHRQMEEQIENTSLSYIEPSASSACEMISEILQYFEDQVKPKALEADCLYAGIIIDTNNFVAKTGVRTFEAAAYLRSNGADVTRVRKALRGDMDSYKARAEAVRHAESYMQDYAISICPSKGLESPNVVGAQAANELLNIVGVKASFVITEYDQRIFISARSIDEVNVQIIMERLGGGGHINIAGAQLSGVTAEEAAEKVKTVLKEMTEEGAI